MELRKQQKNALKSELTRLFFIAVGVFLFILFFQPFPLDTLNYNNRLLYVTGLGGITFLLSFMVFVLLPIIFPKWLKLSMWESGPPILLNIILLLLSITAYAFYVHFVGNTILSVYIIFKIFLVCLLPIIILSILYKNKSLERLIEILQKQNKLHLSRISEFEKNGMEEKIEIFSDSKSDKISLRFRDIIWIKSADNYIEIHYLENDHVGKRLIRNTLKNVEIQLVQRAEFIRCHRTSIVNMMHVEKLIRNYNGYSLRMSGLDQDIAISRQYLIIIKDALSAIE